MYEAPLELNKYLSLKKYPYVKCRSLVTTLLFSIPLTNPRQNISHPDKRKIDHFQIASFVHRCHFQNLNTKMKAISIEDYESFFHRGQ